jgi:GT2 family glycosyltransferase
VSRAIAELAKQSRAPDLIVVSSPSYGDVAGLPNDQRNTVVIVGQNGLTNQRNSILRSLENFDVVVFFDDDFVPCSRYIEEVEAIFLTHSDVVMTTGRVVADGIKTRGLSFEDASELLELDAHTQVPALVTPVSNGYGCNMAIRLDPVFRNRIKFDENLPLYAWLEDVDFSRQLARQGGIVKVTATRGVHLGAKNGRQAGARLGYSQIANPVYLIKKGTCPLRHALFLISRNLAANAVRSFQPEPYVDRIGRLRGNMLALWDLVTGRIHPLHILRL